MSNVVYKNVRKLKNGKFQVEFVDIQGVTRKEVCHDPLSCREHAGLYAPLAAGLGTLINELEEVDEVETGYVSPADYAAKQDALELYDDATLEILENPEGTFQRAPASGKVVCEKCDGELEFRRMKWKNDSYSGNETVAVHKGSPEKDFFGNPSLNKNLNIEGNGAYGSHPTGERHFAAVPSWCRKCGTVGSLTLHHDAYYDRVTCSTEGCGFEDSRSIGD